jgi:hypothetical protein
MKIDLMLALKNPHDPRRFGMLLPIRDWLPGLNEENLLALLGNLDKVQQTNKQTCDCSVQ